MNPAEMYRQRLLTIPEAVSLVQSHQTVCGAMAAAEPVGLLTELANHRDRLQNVRIWVCLPLRQYDCVLKPEMAGHFFVENWFYGAPDRKAHPEGRVSYIPNNLHAAATDKLKASKNRVDVFWGTATPPDKRGYMSLSTCLIYEKMMIEAADLVVLEVNEQLPWTLGDTQVHISEVDYVVEHHTPPFQLPAASPTDWESQIGGHISELVEDGATIQLGIGGIPNAITAFLHERRDLGVHTEMFTDGMVDLYEAGVITNRRKTMWNGKMVGAFALGSQRLYDFVDRNLGVEFQQGKITNDPYIIAQNYKMVSVNTALQVDVLGQVCSQSIGQRHYSGAGGQLDTHRGAQMSPGGRGIIALRSIAQTKQGTFSTIVPMLSEGAGVTVPSHDLDTVVTEFGVAELRGKCVKDRMEELIRVAHPEFRAWIREEAARLGIVPRVQAAGFTPPTSALKATAPGITTDTIRLGTFCDLSGPNAGIGLAALRGYTAYYGQVNRCGGVHGRKIELLVEDDGFDPTRTKLAVIKLLTQDKVFAIVSPLGTPTNLAVRDYLIDKGVPVVSPHSGLSTWSLPPERTYFALQPSYEVEGRILAQYALREIKPQRVAILAVDDQFGQEEATAFTSELSKSGLVPVLSLKHPPREGGASFWVQQVAAAKPDLVLLSTYVKPAADILRAAADVELRPAWLGSYVLSGPDLIRLAGADAAEGLLCTSYPSGPRSHRGERLFRKLMSRLHGEENPGTHSRIGYAAAQLVVEGLRRAGPELTREGLIAAMESIQGWTGGLLPPISYGPDDHRGLTALSLLRAKAGVWIVQKDLLELRD